MKTIIFIALLMSMGFASSYTLPDFGLDRTAITCDNYESLLSRANSDKSRVEGVLAKIPANIQVLAEVRDGVNTACSLVDNIKPLQASMAQLRSKARNHFANTFKKANEKVNKAVEKVDPFDEIFDEKLDEITTVFEQMTSQGSIDNEAIKSRCSEVFAAIDDLSSYLSWAQSQIQSEIIDGFLIPRINQINGMSEECQVGDVYQIRAGYLGPGPLNQGYRESGINTNFNNKLVKIGMCREFGLPKSVALIFEEGEVILGHWSESQNECYGFPLHGRNVKEVIVSYHGSGVTMIKFQLDGVLVESGKDFISVGSYSTSTKSFVIGKKYRLAGLFGNQYYGDATYKFSFTGIGFVLNTYDEVQNILIERYESGMYGTRHNSGGTRDFKDSPAKNLFNAPSQITIRAGALIDAVQLQLYDGKSYTTNGFRGTYGGSEYKLDLAGKTLYRIEVNAGSSVDKLKFFYREGSSGTSRSYGGNGGSHSIIQIPEGSNLVGFKGAYNGVVDQIGFIFDRYDVEGNNNRLRW